VSAKSSSTFAFFFNFIRIWTDRPFFTIILLSIAVAGTMYLRRQRRGGYRGTLGGFNGAIGELEKGLGGLAAGGWMGNGGGQVNGKVD
jgi:hypothetical protein